MIGYHRQNQLFVLYQFLCIRFPDLIQREKCEELWIILHEHEKNEIFHTIVENWFIDNAIDYDSEIMARAFYAHKGFGDEIAKQTEAFARNQI